MTNDEPPVHEPGKTRIIGIFDRAASTYDRIGPRFFSHFGKGLVEQAGIVPGARVLDIACGRGAILFPAADAVGSTGKVIGVDLSHTMVQETSDEIIRLSRPNIEVRQMDAESLQFADLSFDYVLCGFAIFFFPHLQLALSEMRRVLKPKGRIGVSSWDKSISEQWLWFDELVKDFLPPQPTKENEPAEPKSPEPELDTVAGLTGVLTAAGFTDIQVIPDKYEAVYTTGAKWWSSLWSHGTRGTLERIQSSLGADGLERFKSAVFQKLRTSGQVDGIHISWPALYAFGTKPPA